MSYHNTTHQGGQALLDYEHKAVKQEDKVLKYFRDRPHKLITPSEVHKKLFNECVPLTSVRRAITNLTEHKKLEKTPEQHSGPFGRPEYCWRLRTTPTQMELV